LLVDCPFAARVWHVIEDWCGINSHSNKPVSELLEEESGSYTRKEMLYVIKLATLWFIWSSRNELIFQSKALLVEKVVDVVKYYEFFLLKNRAKRSELVWYRCCSFSF